MNLKGSVKLSSEICTFFFLIGWNVHNPLTAKTVCSSSWCSTPVFLLWDFPVRMRKKGSFPKAFPFPCSSQLKRQIAGLSARIKWANGRRAWLPLKEMRMGCSYLNMLPNAAGQKPSVCPLLFFIFQSLWTQCKVFGSNGHLQSP